MSSAVANPPASVPGVTGFRRVWRVLRQLFHEVAAAIFAILAFAWVNYALRAWNRDAAHWLCGVSLCLAAMFAFFALTSFRRSREI
jgi:hypothetical protein